MTTDKYITQLEDLNIYHEIILHPETQDYRSVIAHINRLSSDVITLSDCIPTLIMKSDGHFMAVVTTGDRKVDFRKVKNRLKIRDLRLATPTEFVAATGVPVGAARVYTPGLQTVLDKKIFEKEFLIGGSGNFCSSIRYRTKDLLNIPNHYAFEASRDY